MAREEAVAAFLFLLPNITGFVFLSALPVLASFALAFVDWGLLSPPSFVGLANYVELCSDPLFLKSLGNTAVFVFAKVPLTMAIALSLAVLTNRRLLGRDFFRTLLFLPVVCSSVAVALIWQPLFDLSSGLFNTVIRAFGGKSIPWLVSTEWAMPSVIAVAIWKDIGYFMVIFLAGLQGISSTYYEAAEVDGAGPLTQFFRITVPLLSPTTFFVVITSIIGSFQVFDLTSVMTNGGPGNSTNTLVMYVYQAGFKFFRMGYASAMAYVLFAVILLLTMVQQRIAKEWVIE
jgi:multiple sugar transport system permease protein